MHCGQATSKALRAAKNKRESLRCLRCYRWNHMVRECPSSANTCGTCGSGVIGRRSVRCERWRYVGVDKLQYWIDFLEASSSKDIWGATKYIREPMGYGGKSRIPTLKAAMLSGAEREIGTNEGKTEVLVKSFFPPAPAVS